MTRHCKSKAPHPLLDYLRAEHGLKNDSRLAGALGIRPPSLSKIRHGQVPFGDVMILRAHERLGVPVATIRQLLAA